MFNRISLDLCLSDVFAHVTCFGKKDCRGKVPLSSCHVRGIGCLHDLLLMMLVWSLG